jgi:DNA replication initiation complex subunit (GINS family)
MVEVKITYETLFDLLRREKSRNELQELDKSFYQDVIAYLKEKKRTVVDEDHHTLLFSKSEQEKIRIQIKNIQKILRELYELREKKILNLAVNKVKTESNLIDVSNLLPEEISLFDETCLFLSKYREGILNQVLRMEMPSVEIREQTAETYRRPENDEPQNRTYQKEENRESQKEEKSIFDSQPKNTTYEQSTSSSSDKKVKVKILNDLPKFMGQDKNIYGPYKKEEITELPETVTSILLKKGRVEVI